ncbi:MAG: serine/threonine-protein kinase [Pseudomonadota bacterium]
MATDPFKIIEQAFAHASDLTGDAKIAFLKRFKKTHPDLIDQLERLLDSDRESGKTFSGSVEAAIKAATEDPGDHWLGRQLGVWKLSRRLGSGGMGAVFLASRSDDEFQQTAAVKIMGSQLLNADASSRFRAERQILSNLNHPNIASLIDGGTTDEDLPYLVMEYVDGARIDVHCDSNGLSIRERLSLFVEVCDAIDYAHRNLVVHRDLKPSNILVPRTGTPKLLDFGIAKLLDPDQLELTAPQTSDDARAMTPEYASPEQVRGEPVSVASDVYALGVLLFRLLTGHSPYDASLTTRHEIESAILGSAPRRPSDVVTSASSEAASLQLSKSNPELPLKKLRQRLAGDLDNIVLKCLQKEPERRYATARELASDIDRFLDGRAVLARGDSWAYRAKKFLTRNARPVAAGVAVIATIVALVGFYTVRLADERDKAQLAAAEATEVSDFIRDVFFSAAPRIAQGRDVTALDLLEQAEAQIDEMSEQPLLQGRLMTLIGSSLNGLGEYEKSAVLLSRAVDNIEPFAADNVDDMVSALGRLAEAQRNSGDFEPSLENRRRALALSREAYGDAHYENAAFHNMIGATLSETGRCDEAIPEYQRATEILKDAPEDYAALKLSAQATQAVCFDSLGRYAEAEAVNRSIIPEMERVSGELHPNTINQYSNLGLVLARQWKLEEAIEHFEIAVERGNIVWPAGNRFRATHKHYLSIMLGRAGDFEKALELQREIAASTLEFDGPDSISYAIRLYGSGSLSASNGDLVAAERYFREAAELADSIYGDDGAYTIMSRIYLARSLRQQGQWEQAEDMLGKVAPHIDRIGVDHQVNFNLERASLLSQTDRGEQAVTYLDAVMSLRQGTPERDPSWAQPLTQMASAYRHMGALERAKDLSERAHRIGQEGLPNENWIAALATAEYARVLAELDESAASQPLAKAARNALLSTFGPDDYRVAQLSSILNDP